MKRSARKVAIVLLLFNGISAVFGGISLIYDPSGEFLHMPVELLRNSPFDSFLVPGIILFTVNGVFNLLTGTLGIRKSRLFPHLTVVCGVLLIGWLTVQIHHDKAVLSTGTWPVQRHRGGPHSSWGETEAQEWLAQGKRNAAQIGSAFSTAGAAWLQH